LAGKGKQFLFYGTFKKKSDAVKRESRVPGSFIIKEKHGKLFAVVKPKGRG
jgi:hypothetical protein